MNKLFALAIAVSLNIVSAHAMSGWDCANASLVASEIRALNEMPGLGRITDMQDIGNVAIDSVDQKLTSRPALYCHVTLISSNGQHTQGLIAVTTNAAGQSLTLWRADADSFRSVAKAFWEWLWRGVPMN